MKHNPKITTWCGAAAALVLSLVSRPVSVEASDSTPPAYMTYQSYLTDANGVALGNTAPKSYDMIFSIYNHQSSSGSPYLLWSEQQTVTVDKGNFSVLLGEGSAVGGLHPDLSTLFSGTDISDRFVEVTVKNLNSGTDATIKPRLRLMTSPYAFAATHALCADKLVNGTNASIVNVTGSYVGINKISPSAALDVTGAAAVSGSLSAGTTTVNGTLTAGNTTVGTLTASSAGVNGALSVGGNTSVSGTLTAGTTIVGALTASSTTVGGALCASSATVAGMLTVTNVTVTGTISGNGTIPVGGIIMWSGASVPSGWTLCNGSNVNGLTVPDLRGRFILGGNVGSGATYTDVNTGLVSTNGTYGGEAKHTLSLAEMPAHTHNFLADASAIFLVTPVDNGSDKPDSAGAGGYGYINANRPSAVQNSGSGTPFSELPPYYVLAYIMRVQ